MTETNGREAMKTNVGVGRGCGVAGLACLGLPPLSAQEPKLTLKGHTSPVWSVAYSPDGKWLASGSGPTIQLATPHGKTLASGSGTRRSSCGTWRPARSRPPSRGTPAWCIPWRSARTARRWPRGARTRRSSCGTWQTGKEQATLKGHTEHGVLRGVQPGRQDAGLGERGQDDQAVGRGDGQGAGHPQGAHETWCVLRGVQPGRQDAGLGERMTRRSSCGTWRRARSRPPSRGTRRGVLRGVQPGRQDAGLGELGQDDQAVGRGDGQGTGHPQGAHGRRCMSVAFSPDGKTLASGSLDPGSAILAQAMRRYTQHNR